MGLNGPAVPRCATPRCTPATRTYLCGHRYADRALLPGCALACGGLGAVMPRRVVSSCCASTPHLLSRPAGQRGGG